MGIRETINQRRSLSVGVAIGVIVLGAAWTAYRLWPRHSAQKHETGGFCTVDDGQSFFRAPLSKIPPFEHEGQTAVRAYVFKAGGKEFVGYLEQFTPEGKRKIEAFLAANPQVPPTPGIYKTEVELRETLVKRPGDAEWTPCSNERKVVEITTVKGPDGSPAVPVEAGR